jgi:hypothetical protein
LLKSYHDIAVVSCIPFTELEDSGFVVDIVQIEMRVRWVCK